MIHHIKIWPIYFQAIEEFRKTFECRLNDRDYQENDTVRLYEWNPQSKTYTGRVITARIGFVITRTCRAQQYALFSLLDIKKLPYPTLPPIDQI